MTGGGSHRGPYDGSQDSGESGWSGAYGRPGGQESGNPGGPPSGAGPSTGPVPAYPGSPYGGSPGAAPWERSPAFGDTSGASTSEPQSQTPGFGPGGADRTQSFGAGPGAGYGTESQGAHGTPTSAYGPGTGPLGPSGPPPGTGFGPPPAGGDPQGPHKKSRGGLFALLAAGAVVLALVAGGVGGVVGAQLDDDSTTNTANNQPLGGDPSSRDSGEVPAPAGSVQQVAADTLPSVVSIDVTAGNEQGEGSGVVLSADGIIMTNNHVVSGSNGRPAGDVVVNFQDGSRASARVLGADPISDIAVIKVDKTGLRPIKVGTSDNLAVGQDVIAIGAPLGLEGTVTTGIISALNRPVSTTREGDTTSVIDAIQTDAAINPGNSGGALVNARGALIGVNTAIATLGGSSQEQQSGSIGLGFAIPIDQAIRVANELRDTGKATHAGLGVSVRPSTDPNAPGALIADVQAGGPAAAAGIPKGAVVTKIDDRNITTGDALVAAVRSYKPGDRVQVTYTAGGQTKTATVTLATLQSN
ncbi:S1C family serine protease [Gordonia sp. DT30]|uniref:S1C family serine protease n=1 Tax=unclassified Gordonia (in: high G+C Gram-positive bacteria) TaxID=2657482 RepID=UPI003CF14901